MKTKIFTFRVNAYTLQKLQTLPFNISDAVNMILETNIENWVKIGYYVNMSYIDVQRVRKNDKIKLTIRLSESVEKELGQLHYQYMGISKARLVRHVINHYFWE